MLTKENAEALPPKCSLATYEDYLKTSYKNYSDQKVLEFTKEQKPDHRTQRYHDFIMKERRDECRRRKIWQGTK